MGVGGSAGGTDPGPLARGYPGRLPHYGAMNRDVDNYE